MIEQVFDPNAVTFIFIAIGGLFGSIAGIFGSIQEKRAAGEAVAIINQARQQGLARSDALNAEFTPFITASQGYLGKAEATIGESQGLLQQLIAQTQGLDTGAGGGLSEADKINYADAAKLLNEQMVSTGNLRSGAAAFGHAQLLRRVFADASQRQFDRQVAKLGLLYGGQSAMASTGNQYAGLAGTSGQIGLYGKQLSNQILAASMGLSVQQGAAEMAKGAALGQAVTAGGMAGDTALNMLLTKFGGAGGASVAKANK